MSLKLRSGEKTDLDEAFRGTYKNCGNETWVRRVEYFSAIKLGRENQSRGFMDLCFKCDGPKILWNSKEYGNMRSPAGIPYEELDGFLSKYFSSKSDSLRSKEEI